jgi:hydrogenase-4 membrane subunit HyfE
MNIDDRPPVITNYWDIERRNKMFYLIAGVWILAALFIYGLRKAQVRYLGVSCPCLTVAAIIAAVSLFALQLKTHAYIVLGVGLSLSALILIAFLVRRNLEHQKIPT